VVNLKLDAFEQFDWYTPDGIRVDPRFDALELFHVKDPVGGLMLCVSEPIGGDCDESCRIQVVFALVIEKLS
jgi:hypothetical protein